MSQSAYVASVLRRFGMVGCNAVRTPMIRSFFNGLDGVENRDVVDIKLYEQAIGSLLYLALRIRPDILTPVLILARYQKAPCAFCHAAVKRILRYLKGSPNLGIQYIQGDLRFWMFVDSDYAEDTTDRKSMGGYFGKVGQATVHWGAKKQTAVAVSTCEAEYVAMSIACQEILWIRRVLEESGVPTSGPTLVRSDNVSGKNWADGEKLPARAKHIDVRYHFIRDLVQKEIVQVEHVSTDDNDADLLTKPLGRAPFEAIIERIGLKCAVEEEC